ETKWERPEPPPKGAIDLDADSPFCLTANQAHSFDDMKPHSFSLLTLGISLSIMTLIDSASGAEASITHKPFGEIDGEAVTLFTLTNEKGMTADIMNYGGVVVRLMTPDKEG